MCGGAHSLWRKVYSKELFCVGITTIIVGVKDCFVGGHSLFKGGYIIALSSFVFVIDMAFSGNRLQIINS